MIPIPTIRARAQDVLRDNGISVPPVPVDLIAKNLGAVLRYSPFEGELAGMVFRQGAGVIIGVNSLHHIHRQRFTIAHEIGHYLLHEGKEVHIDRDLSVHINLRNPERKDWDPDEVDANRFAAELLMPYEMIIDEIGKIDAEDENELRALASKYQVSLQAMTIRISTLMTGALREG